MSETHYMLCDMFLIPPTLLLCWRYSLVHKKNMKYGFIQYNIFKINIVIIILSAFMKPIYKVFVLSSRGE